MSVFSLRASRSATQSKPNQHHSQPLSQPLSQHDSHSDASDATPAALTLNSSSGHGFGTLAVHAGSTELHAEGAVIEPISLSTTFAQAAPGQPIGTYEYSRSGNPNRDIFERAVAALEHARYAVSFASGSAATATILQALAAPLPITFPPAAPLSTDAQHLAVSSTVDPFRVISVSDVYGGTHRYFTRVAHAHNIVVLFAPELNAATAADLITPDVRLLWIETPSNPTLKLTDIRSVATVAHEHKVLVVVDNTFLSPYLQNPLDLGADIVLHSVTKYINGHSDVVMGVAATNNIDIWNRLVFLQNAGGAVPSPFDCWLARRGMRTLHLRVREASRSADLVARALEASPHVLAVHYPGLDSHPQRDIALRQHRDGLGGAMISFRIRGGRAAADRFCQRTRIFTLAESLGGVESLVEMPSSMTHAGIPRDEREAVGVFDDLIRLSVGVEEAEDLLRDVQQALDGTMPLDDSKSSTGAHMTHIEASNMRWFANWCRLHIPSDPILYEIIASSANGKSTPNDLTRNILKYIAGRKAEDWGYDAYDELTDPSSLSFVWAQDNIHY